MGAITHRIKEAKDDFSQKLYFKEDIELLIAKLKLCIETKATDTEQTVRSKIIRMFASHGIELQKNLTPKQYEEQLHLNGIRSVKAFPELCWKEMMKVNTAYKTPREYMERLVNELVSPEYDSPDSTVRVKILKQFLGALDCLRGTSFQSKKIIEIIQKDYGGNVKNIGDEIFKNYLTPIMPHKYLKVLIDVYGELLYCEDEKDGELTKLVSEYDSTAGGKTARELLRLIRANNPKTKTDGNGKTVDTYNIADFDRTLIDRIKSRLDGARVIFKEKYDGDLKIIEASGQKIHIRCFAVITEFVSEHKLFDILKTKRFVSLVNANTEIRIEETSDGFETAEKLRVLSVSDEAAEKLNGYLLKQIAKLYEKADVTAKNDYKLFLSALKDAENNIYRLQLNEIESFVGFRELYGSLITDELKKKLSIPEDVEVNNLTVIKNGNAEELKTAVDLLIKRLKQFRTETNQKFEKGLDNVSDRSSIPEILKISNDLANGKYKKGPEMKEILYLFAFAFDMSVDFESGKEKTLRDIKKNLFEDFYCDNIIRYVNDYHLNGVYDEPTGITIQFKNFVEIVYLYWLNQSSERFSQAEKYLSANAMIKKIVSKIKSAEKDVENNAEKTGKKYSQAKRLAGRKSLGTYVYRNFLKTDSEYGDESLKIDNFLTLPEDEFMQVILDNYDVDTKIKYTTSAAFENESYQEIAASDFSALIDELKTETEGFGLVSSCYPLEFYETVFEELFSDKEYDTYSHKQLSSLVKKINEQMKQVLSEAESDDYGTFTRTRYMYLYYNHFIQSRITERYTETFDDFCDEYCEQLNIDLETCSYQRFSEKNLIDIMLLYSAFITLRTEVN